MNARTFLIILVFLLVPAFASADCITDGDGAACPLSSGATGTCSGGYCQAATTNPSPTTNQNPSPTVNPTVNNNNGQNVTLINPLQGGGSLESFLNNILAFVIRIGTIVVILMMVFVGYKFVAAQGKEEAIREARQMLLWTVVGALILLGAQAIAIAIKATVGALSTGG